MDKRTGIKAPGIAFSEAALFYLTFIYIGMKFAFLILFLPLSHFFPILKEHGYWITALPEILVFGIMLSYSFCSFYSVILYKDKVILKWLGIKIREIPASEFKSFCAVGNDREDVLCLSRYSFEEMVRMQEVRLSRGVFTKHELPFMKRKPNWQDDFARAYLNRLRRSPLGAFKKRSFIMLEMHPTLQYTVRKMYPHLPYKNLTGITSPYLSRFSERPENRAVCFTLQASEYTFRMEPDGIHIETNKKEIFSIPAQQIKTAVRVDVFRSYDKFNPHHTPLLFITTMSEEELIQHPRAQGCFTPRLNETEDVALSAMTAAFYLIWRWNKNHTNSCTVPLTEKNLETVRTLYPHVSVNEISSGWIADS